MKRVPLTKKQVQEIKPKPFEPVLAHTRYRNGQPVPVNAAEYSPPRLKRVWSNEKHEYVVKLARP